MTEPNPQLVVHKSALEETHRRLGATMRIENGWSIPASYGDELSEYNAVRKQGVGLFDLSARGRLLVSGSEAVAFLNGLITNDMKTLAENRWMPAAFPNVQGRLIASVRVIRFADEVSTGKAVPQFLIDIEAANYNSILQALDRFTLAGDFRVTDLTDRLAMLSLQGTDVLRVARTVLPNLEMERYAAQQVAWLNGSVNVIRATHTAEDGLDLLVNVHDCEALWKAMLEAGFLNVGFDALETLRVEAGEPRYGVDMDETNVISETNLDEAISFTKGCYIGQEIIARIKYRGHVAKKLTGLMFAGAANISAGTRILSAEEKEIGRLTSVTFSPTLNRLIALGYLKYDYLSPGTKVEAVGEDYRLPAVVTEPPFIRGSWYTG